MVVGDTRAASLSEVAGAIRARKVSPIEVLDSALEQIARQAPAVNCYITVAAERARLQAQALEALLAAGTYLGPLHGIPLSVKDCLETAGVRSTAGSPILADNVPVRDARAVDLLQRAGAIVLAKDNMYDFQYCAPNARYGATANVWDRSCTTGGSSSGSAAAVAAGLSFASLGTDGGGSIRMPSSFNGVVGVKPTYALVSNVGELPCAGSVSCVGPIARTVRDAAIVLDAIAEGEHAGGYLDDLEQGVDGLTLGVPDILEAAPVDAEVRGAFAAACRALEDEGARIVRVAFPDFLAGRAAMWIISGTEYAAALHPHLRSRPDDFHPVTRALFERAQFIPATDYVNAQRVRRALAREAARAMRAIDALILPTVAIPAFALDRQSVELDGVVEEPLNLSTRFTALFNITGQPALTVPCGFTTDGLPLGLQVAARPFEEARALRVARAFERATEWHLRRPQLVREGAS